MYYIIQMQSEYSLVGLIKIIISLFICYYISIFIHELGHIIGFKVYGYQIIFAAVGPIIYTNYRKKVIKFKISNFIIGGGMAPKISKLENKYQLKRFFKSYQLSLLMGPVMILILLLLCVLFIFINGTKTINVYPLFLIITNSILFIYSFIKAMGVEGDIYLYYKYKSDNQLAFPNVFRFSLLNDTYNTFLENEVKNKLVSIHSMKDLDDNMIALIGEYTDFCTVQSKKVPIQIDIIINEWIKKYNPLNNDKLKFNRDHMILFCKFLKNKVLTNNDIDLYKKFYERYLYDYESNHELFQFYKNKTDFILQLSTSDSYLKEIQVFHNEVMSEYLIENHFYINRLISFDEKVQ